MPLFTGERKYNCNPSYPYECPFCDSSWGKVEFLQQHMENTHAEDLQDAQDHALAQQHRTGSPGTASADREQSDD